MVGDWETEEKKLTGGGERACRWRVGGEERGGIAGDARAWQRRRRRRNVCAYVRSVWLGLANSTQELALGLLGRKFGTVDR
jgi:hypothetical protein